MLDDTLLVVGDRFEEFLTNRRTISASALLWALRTGNFPDHMTIVVGQGLTEPQRGALRDLVGRAEKPIQVAGGLPERAEQRQTHKHDPRNILIGDPVRIDDVHFVADLVLDQDVEVLADHLTGQHIPAVTLTEAARQMWTAVTERFFADGAARFVIASVNGTFHRFVFPLPTQLRYELRAHTTSVVDELFHCVVGVHQLGNVCAEIEARYRLIPETVARKQEAMAARQGVAHELARPTDHAVLLHQ
jgi:hypothetical protein